MYETIKDLCKRNGTSINELEKTLGFSRGSLCKIDTTSPSLSKIVSISEYFNVNINYIVYGENFERPDEDEYDEEIIEMAEYFMKYNKEQKKALLNLMRSFAL